MAKSPKNKKGFTLVETTLVLAISVAVLMAFVVTISTRVGRERYKDATNSFADFLRRMYSEVINVENDRSGPIGNYQNNYCTLAGRYAAEKASTKEEQDKNKPNPESDGYPGRSGCSIYGKLITFGEKYGTTDEDNRLVYAYDVIGRAIDISHPLRLESGKNSIIDQLAAVNADVLTFVKNEETNLCSVLPVGTVQSFDPAWSSSIESTSIDTPFRGALLIVRSPSSGAVHTYVLGDDKELQIRRAASGDYTDISCGNAVNVYDAIDNTKSELYTYLKNGEFEERDANFCIGSGESFMALPTIKRNNIRVKADGHNATAVEFVETDLAKSEGGNQCD